MFPEVWQNSIYTALLALLPITELRAAIPIAVGVFSLSPITAFFWATSGNLLVAFFLLPFLDNLVSFITKFKKTYLGRPVYWLMGKTFLRTRRKAWSKYQVYGKWVLFLFVAIPLPGTGAWTGSLIAYLFDIPRRQSYLFISAGVIVAGVLVTLATLGLISIL